MNLLKEDDTLERKIFTKLLILLLIMSLALFMFNGCGTKKDAVSGDKPEQNDAVAQMIFSEFEKLAAIPRRSGNEKAVSDYIVSRAEEMGLKTVQDEFNNVIVEKPAREGYEKLPLVILQAHTDMVCLADDGVEYDPASDPIKIVKDGNKIHAEGTTLGADDGIGVSMVLSILTGDYMHGPLRAVFTTDEEVDMTGASGLDAKYLTDAKYLINVDWEDSASLCTSSADATAMEISFTPEWGEPLNDKAFTVEVSGLLGGHSGLEINKGRANAIKIAAGFLGELSGNGIPFEVAEFSGGLARNSIPANANVTFTVKSSDAGEVSRLFGDYAELCTEGYGGVENNMSLKLADASMPSRILKNNSDLIGFITTAPINVHTMSPIMAGLVESSSNIGVIGTADEKIHMQIFARSSAPFFSHDLKRTYETLAKNCGLDFKTISASPGWKLRAQSDIVPLMEKIYKEQTGSEILVTPIHAGLECGWFAAKNSDLDIVSIGPKVDNAHSPQETLYYDSIPVTFNLLLKTLESLK